MLRARQLPSTRPKSKPKTPISVPMITLRPSNVQKISEISSSDPDSNLEEDQTGNHLDIVAVVEVGGDGVKHASSFLKEDSKTIPVKEAKKHLQ